MLVILAFALFLSLTLMIFAFTSATVAPSSTIQERLRVLLGRSAQRAARPTIHERVEQALEPLSKVMPRSMEELSRTRAWLMQAGLREPRYVTIYYGLRIFFLLAFTFTVAASTGFSPRRLGLALVCGILGYFLPRFFLKRLITARHHAIRLALPDALDLAIICVEAGLSLDQSL